MAADPSHTEENIEIYKSNATDKLYSDEEVVTEHNYILVLHQTISATSCYVVSKESGEFITFHEIKNNVIVKKPGYLELVPNELIENANTCMRVTVENFQSLEYDPKRISCLSVCTSPSLTLVWNRVTGKALYPALAEDDCRCEETCHRLVQRSWRRSRTNFQHACGLPLSGRWLGVKLRWLLDSVSAVAEASRARHLLAGGLDSWLLWRLCGGVHLTEPGAASRTMLMNLHRTDWDSGLCRLLDVDQTVLPTVLQHGNRQIAEARCEGLTLCGGTLPVCGLSTELKAAIEAGGPSSWERGSVTVHIDACSGLVQVSICVGEEPLLYRSTIPGLGHPLTTAASAPPGGSSIGSDDAAPSPSGDSGTRYCIEVTLWSVAGMADWLTRGLQLVNTAIGEDLDSVSSSVPDCGMVLMQLQPGDDAVALLGLRVGESSPGHVLRAGLEAVATEIARAVGAVSRGCGVVLVGPLRVGGDGRRGLSSSEVFCSLLADFTGLEVARLAMAEPPAVVGAAMACGNSVGGLQDLLLLDRFPCSLSPGRRQTRLDRRLGPPLSVNLTTAPSSTSSWPLRVVSVLALGLPFSLLGFGLASWLLATRR